MSIVSSVRPESIEILTRGASETFTESPRTTIKVPSCRPTPLIGSWADESWPLNSRQASEIITEQVLQKQRSSTIFEDADGNVTFGEVTEFQPSHERSPSSVDDEETVNESLMQEAMSHAQVSEEVSAEADSPTHVAQCYMFDPYNIHDAHVVISRCSCEECVAVLLQKQAASLEGPTVFYETDEENEEEEVIVITENDSASRQITPAAPAAPKTVDSSSPMYSTNYPVYETEVPVQGEEEAHSDWDLPTYRQKISPSLAQAPIHHYVPEPSAAAPLPGGFMTHTQISSPPFMEQATPQPSPGQMNATPGSTVSGLSHPPPTQRRFIPETERPAAQPREISQFMPPPPPPRISTLVFEEEGSIRNPSGVYYHLVMRWYSKVIESQDFFVTAQSRCPAPNKEKYSFEQWCDEISGWWYTHFENLQKKGPRFVAAPLPRRRQ